MQRTQAPSLDARCFQKDTRTSGCMHRAASTAGSVPTGCPLRNPTPRGTKLAAIASPASTQEPTLCQPGYLRAKQGAGFCQKHLYQKGLSLMDNSHSCLLPWGVTAWEGPCLVPGHCPSPSTPHPGPAPQTADLEILRKIKSVQHRAWKQAAVSGSNKARVTPERLRAPTVNFFQHGGERKAGERSFLARLGLGVAVIWFYLGNCPSPGHMVPRLGQL